MNKPTSVKRDPSLAAPLRLLESLSPMSIWIYALGYTLIAGTIAFLIFLWSSDATNFVWHQIALTGWIPKCISLASSVLRVSITLQAGTATSMSAALLLQQFDVRLPHAAAISMMRWENSGPHALGFLILRNFNTGRNPLIYSIILMMTLTTTVSQFTSTLLLTDIHQSLTISNQNTSSIPSELDYKDASINNFKNFPAPYWSITPNIFPTFAEYHVASEQEDTIHDTGPTFRAFLPLNDQSQRSSLHEYAGAATVLDARAICVKPKLKFSVNFTGSYYDSSFFKESIQLVGSVGPDTTLNSYFEHPEQFLAFNCSAPFGSNAFPDSGNLSSSEWQLTVCALPSETVYPDGIYQNGAGYTNPFLIFNTSGDFEAWYEASLDPNWTEETAHNQSYSEWAIFTSNATPLTRTLNKAKFAASLCFAPMSGTTFNITAWGGKSHVEARFNWNFSTGAYDTQGIRFSLGATSRPGSLSDRGHLQMERFSWQTLSNDAPSYNSAAFSDPLSRINIGNQSTYFCSSCFNGQSFSVNNFLQACPAVSAIFNDVVRYTGHPALALQASFTVVSGVSYYNLQPLFLTEVPASITTYVTVVVPTQWVGLPVVIALALVHCFLTAVVLILYMRSPRRSIIGSAWSALAQVAQSPTIQEWLRSSSMVDDDTFAERLKVSGQHQSLVGVDLVDGGQVVVKLRKSE